MKRLVLLFVLFSNGAFALERYFANEEIQRLAPEAFALQPEASEFHQEIILKAKKERESFLSLIRSDKQLVEKIQKFKDLDWKDKEEVLRQIFSLEVKALGMRAPELIIDNTTIKGQAYFDFDIQNPGAGRVILNLEEISKDPNPHAGLLLLIHETRHSAQFQEAFEKKGAAAKAYKASFSAQKKYQDKITSFSDFLTLINEYEAFQFGNYVVQDLLEGGVDTLGMGTFASQYNQDFTLKIDLPGLFKAQKEGQLNDKIINIFNKLEKSQYDILTAQ